MLPGSLVSASLARVPALHANTCHVREGLIETATGLNGLQHH